MGNALDNRPRVVAVRGFTADCENDLIVHMEHFGELVDMDFAAAGRGKPVTAYFTYKTRRDAEQVCPLPLI
uniref:RRM domain-containing protein n=1 Tax=Parascaris equorum TaxID=6256 RepID=A0A914RGC0_PAREQ